MKDFISEYIYILLTCHGEMQQKHLYISRVDYM
jgi:hypothetical protein